MNYPQTRAEAESQSYGTWAGDPKGMPFNPERCAANVADGVRSCLFHQCSNKPGKGPDGLYCSVHAKRAEQVK